MTNSKSHTKLPDPSQEDILATEAWLDQEHAYLAERIRGHAGSCECLDCLEFEMLFFK